MLGLTYVIVPRAQIT